MHVVISLLLSIVTMCAHYYTIVSRWSTPGMKYDDLWAVPVGVEKKMLVYMM